MSDNVKIVPASCTQCGGSVEVDPNTEKATCPFCGMTFIVEKAINNYNVQHATIEHADNVNIDMSGTVKTVLDFVGDQIKEGREERKEQKKIEAEKDKMMTKGMLKIFTIMMVAMFVFAIIAFIIMQFTDNDESDSGETSYSNSREWSVALVDLGDGVSVPFCNQNGTLTPSPRSTLPSAVGLSLSFFSTSM